MPVLEPASRRRRHHRRGVFWRRRLVALAALLVPIALVAAAVNAFGGDDAETAREGSRAPKAAAPKPPPPPELPRGGRRIFPDFRVVGFYGNPRAEGLGILGIGSPSQMRKKLIKQMAGYQRKSRPVLPMYELISTIVNPVPGEDGTFNTDMPDSMIRRYLRAARRAKALLVLDIQPGAANFLTETRRLRKWLKEPDVGLALDPEWRMGPGEIPGQVIGSVTAAEVNRVSAYVQGIIRRYRLPEKLFIVHQFTPDMIEDKQDVRRREGLAIVMNVDGFGTPAAKLDKWRAFTSEATRFHDGYKLFYEEDTDLMSPREVMAMQPRPDLVMYE
jgi:hypothetical protein